MLLGGSYEIPIGGTLFCNIFLTARWGNTFFHTLELTPTLQPPSQKEKSVALSRNDFYRLQNLHGWYTGVKSHGDYNYFTQWRLIPNGLKNPRTYVATYFTGWVGGAEE